MNYSDHSSAISPNAASSAPHGESVDATRIASAVNEILIDMDQGACAETIAQTVQVVTLANGKKAAVRVLVTTNSDLFL